MNHRRWWSTGSGTDVLLLFWFCRGHVIFGWVGWSGTRVVWEMRRRDGERMEVIHPNWSVRFALVLSDSGGGGGAVRRAESWGGCGGGFRVVIAIRGGRGFRCVIRVIKVIISWQELLHITLDGRLIHTPHRSHITHHTPIWERERERERFIKSRDIPVERRVRWLHCPVYVMTGYRPPSSETATNSPPLNTHHHHHNHNHDHNISKGEPWALQWSWQRYYRQRERERECVWEIVRRWFVMLLCLYCSYVLMCLPAINRPIKDMKSILPTFFSKSSTNIWTVLPFDTARGRT